MSENVRWYQFHVNPEPWAVGPVSVGKRGGKMIPVVGRNQQMDAYKSAIREELEEDYPSSESFILPPSYSLDFFFWRRLDASSDGSRRQHQADTTNMVKATEDALQGILIGNDRDVLRVQGITVAQGPEVIPGVVVRIEWDIDSTDALRLLPKEIELELLGYRHLTLVRERPKELDNEWPPRS